MTEDAKIVHIAFTDQDPDIPKPGEATKDCKDPECPGERGWDTGYGMAGGGMGMYTYCPKCGDIINKTQDPGD